MKKSLREDYLERWGIILKNHTEIEAIRRACKLAAKVLDGTCRLAKIGITTDELNTHAHQALLKAGAIPAPLGFGEPPFPKSICTSLNDVICHGIPDKRPLQEGDILKIDVSCSLNGFYGDCCSAVMIGHVTPEKKRVVEAAYAALMTSIAILKPGIPLYEIGNAIESVAAKYNCSVVDQFVGHGVGIGFREPPAVLHHYNKIATPLAPGMTFTIEPMINAGVCDATLDDDGWTAHTADGKPTAQWEHTVLITEHGHEILTLI